jgi:hypothetical protein
VDELLCLARSSATTTCDDRDPFVIGDKGT